MTRAALDLAAALALLLLALAMMRGAALRGIEGYVAAALARGPARGWAAVLGLCAGAGVRTSTVLARFLAPALAGRTLTSPAALAALLGAAVGGGLAAVALAASPPGAYQVLLVGGALASLGTGARRRDIAGVMLGAALTLMSLGLLAKLASPLAQAPVLAALVAPLAADALLAATIGAMLAFLLRSGLPAVLLLAILCAEGVLQPGAALAMMLGANLGTGLVALAATAQAPSQARGVAIGLLLARMPAIACGLLVLHHLGLSLTRVTVDGALLVTGSHLLLNLAVALTSTYLSRPMMNAVSRWVPADTAATGVERLDSRTLPAPSVALACAVREVARLADLVEVMLGGMLQVCLREDPALARSMHDMDDAVDDGYRSVKQYLAALRRQPLSRDEGQRLDELMTFAIALEQLADAVQRVLRDLGARTPASKGAFPDPAVTELRELHAALMHNFRLAVKLLLDRDDDVAQDLAAADRAFGQLQHAHETAHLERLSMGRAGGVELSAVYLDLLGDLKQMNTLLCSLADCFVPPRSTGDGSPRERSPSGGYLLTADRSLTLPQA